MSASNDDVLDAVRGVAAEQGRVAEALIGHTRLDDERFKTFGEKLDRIDGRTEQTGKDVQSLKDTRTFNAGRAWAVGKLVGLIAALIGASELIKVALAWARGGR